MDCSIRRHNVRSRLYKASGEVPERLTVFFSGWATDEGIMKVLFPDGLPEGVGDVLLCYGHQDFVLNSKLFEGYSRIRLVAWSLGVWAAEFACGMEGVKFEECVAVNGTVFPVSETYGIPPEIYKGTLENLNDRNLYKFRLRMCGGRENYSRFMACPPNRDMDDIKEELKSILLKSSTMNWAHLKWTKAVVCSQDAIFPPENQIRSWKERGLEPQVLESSHFPADTLRQLLVFASGD